MIAGDGEVPDLEAAADILADALIVEVAEEVEAEAMDDYSDQEDLIAEAEVWEAEDALEGDVEGALLDDDILADAEIQKEIDEEVVLASEAVIAAAYLDAASALLAAELIDAVNLSPVAVLIADTAEQVGVAELVLARNGVLDVTERAVERQDAVGHAGIDHAGDRVVPEILLVRGPVGLDVGVALGIGLRVGPHEIAGVATADAGGLHAPVRGEVGRAEREPLHPR